MKRVTKSGVAFLSLILMLTVSCCVLSGCKLRDPEINADITSVPVMAQSVKITFGVENTEFNQTLENGNISLTGAFEEMTVKIENVTEKEAQIVLNGDIKRSNAYEDGIIEFTAGAFSDSELSLASSFEIEEEKLSFEESSFKLENGLLSVNISTSGYAIASLSASDITIENFIVASASIENDIITLSIETGAETLDEAIAEINQKTITFSASAFGTKEDISVIGCFNTAGFYFSVSDILYNPDDSMDLILDLTVCDGTFADDSGASNIGLNGNVVDGTVTDVEVNENVATVTIRMSAESGEEWKDGFDASVELTENSLINNWGTKLTDPVSFYQIILPSVNLSTSADSFYTTMNDFSKYVGSSDLTKALGPIGPLVYLTTGLVTTSYDICKLCGFVESQPSEFEQLCAKLDVISEHLSNQDKQLKQIIDMLGEIKTDEIREKVSEFTEQISLLEAYTKSVSAYIKKGANDKTLMDGVTVPADSLEGVSKTLLQSREKGVADDKLLDTLSESEKGIYNQWKDYFDTLFGKIEEKASSKVIRGNSYTGYYDAVESLTTLFKTICIGITSNNGDIFNKYDYLCTKLYLFDITAIPAREAYRASARTVLDYAISMLMQVYGGLNLEELSNSVVFNDLYDNYYIPAVGIIENSEVKRVMDVPGYENMLYFYPSDEQKNVYFSLLKYEYDVTEAATSEAKRKEIEKKATAYYENMRKRLFWSNLSSGTLKSVKDRLKGLGYEIKDYYNELMVYEAKVVADVLGYPTGVDIGGNTGGYYYLQSFDSFTLGFREGSGLLVVEFKNCVMYDMLTGELKKHDTYTYFQSHSNTRGIYVLNFISTKN